jgi:PST family polysaccharide transporter
LAGNVYGQGAIIIVGLSAGKTSAGYYAIAQKIAVAISGLAQPFAQSLYPYLCNLYEENRSNYIKFKRNALLIGIIIFTIIGIVNYLFSDRISKLISGIIDKELVSLIEIYSVIIIMTMMNIMLNVFILSMKKFLEIQKMYLHAAAIFLIIGIPVTFIYGSQGMAFSIMIIESYILVSGFIIAKTPYHSLIKRSNYEQ